MPTPCHDLDGHGWTKGVCLTAIGDSKEGAETCLEEDAFAVMVDKVDKIEARWVQHRADTEKRGIDFPHRTSSSHRICFDRPLLS